MSDPRKPEEKIRHAERRATALDLRAKNWTLKRIAEHLGVSEQRAHQMISEELRRKPAEKVAELRAVEVEKLSELGQRMQRSLNSPDPDETMKAAQMLVRIGERLSKLMGLDAPLQTQGKLGITVGAPDVSEMSAEQLADVAEQIAADLRARGESK